MEQSIEQWASAQWDVKMVEVVIISCTCSASKLGALQLSFLCSLGVVGLPDSEFLQVQHWKINHEPPL